MIKNNRLLVDTCALIYLATATKLKPAVISQLDEASSSGRLHVSPISAWEVARATTKEQIALTREPLMFFNTFIRETNALLCDLSPQILIDSWFLPGRFHKDPMDRILVATARFHDFTLVTSDRAILAYGQQGHVKTLAC